MNEKAKEIHLRITEEEYQMLLQQRDFLKYSSIAQVLRAYIHSGHCYRFDMSGLYDFSTQISRVGNNINQIARKANAGFATREETTRALRMLDEVYGLLYEVAKQ